MFLSVLPLCRWLVLFIVQVQVLAGWLMDNLGLGAGGQRGVGGGRRPPWRNGDISLPLFIRALFLQHQGVFALGWSAGRRDDAIEGWMGQGVDVRGGVDRATERWRSHGVKMWDTYEEMIRDTKTLCFVGLSQVFNLLFLKFSNFLRSYVFIFFFFFLWGFSSVRS